jgi:hypothetical protein
MFLIALLASACTLLVAFYNFYWKRKNLPPGEYLLKTNFNYFISLFLRPYPTAVNWQHFEHYMEEAGGRCLFGVETAIWSGLHILAWGIGKYLFY